MKRHEYIGEAQKRCQIKRFIAKSARSLLLVVYVLDGPPSNPACSPTLPEARPPKIVDRSAAAKLPKLPVLAAVTRFETEDETEDGGVVVSPVVMAFSLLEASLKVFSQVKCE
jgi:hypothetical protein